MSSVANTTDRRGSIMPSKAGGASKKAGSGVNQSSKNYRMSISTRRKGSLITTDKGAHPGPKKQLVRIMDESGMDVTPQSLLQIDPNAPARHSKNFLGTGSESGGIGTPTDAQSQYSVYQQSSIGAPVSKPVWASGEESYRSSRDSVAEDFAEPGAREPAATGLAEVVTRHEQPVEELTPDDLEKDIEIVLTETETMWLLDLPSQCVEEGTEESEETKEKIKKYQKLIKDRVGNDLYAERGMQTFDNGRKVKHVQTNKLITADVACMATTWDMYDSFAEFESKEEAPENTDDVLLDGGDSRPASPGADDKSVAESDASKTVGSTKGSVVMGADGKSIAIRSVHASVTTDVDSVFAGSSLGNAASMTQSAVQTQVDESALKSDAAAKSLFIMERVVVQNIYQSKLAMYRGMSVYPDIDIYIEPVEESDSITFKAPSTAPQSVLREKSMATSVGQPMTGPHLERLWSFACDLTKGYTVLCITWNKQNPDILAVGYGQSTYRGQSGGLVCCWCIKNIQYPERVYKCESGVTAVDFSSAHPNLLGVGTYDGSVYVYDVSTKEDKPVLDNMDSVGKHTGPVWEVKWVERERVTGEDKGEILVSISADGRVNQWSVRKGFEHFEVMKLKKVLQSKGHAKAPGGGESLINRFSSGMGFAFKASDTNIYIAGTEDGHIHRCSCSYNEQFLATYYGHTAPVYKVTWSPFVGDVFLSASADWSMRIWHQDNPEPLLTLQPSLKAVTDVCWSPFSPTIVGCTTEDAVQIFDLEISVIDPVVTHPTISGKLTAFAFASNSPCVVFGDTNGQVSVMKVFNVFTEEQEEAAYKGTGVTENAHKDSERLAHVIQETFERMKQTEDQKKRREAAKAAAAN